MPLAPLSKLLSSSSLACIEFVFHFQTEIWTDSLPRGSSDGSLLDLMKCEVSLKSIKLVSIFIGLSALMPEWTCLFSCASPLCWNGLACFQRLIPLYVVKGLFL